MDQTGIEFSLQTDFSVLPVKEEDFYILLGNLLDNAMEAAGKCEPERRRILLKLYCVNEMFCICLENTSIEYPQVENGKFRSTKEEKGHGFGIENIRSIVENYGGTIRFGYTNVLHIMSIRKGELLMRNGKTIPPSRNREEDVREKVLEYWSMEKSLTGYYR